MDKSGTILSFFDPKNDRREEALRRGFQVVSVESAAQAGFEIEMGRCGIFIICTVISDLVSTDLLNY